QFHFVSEQTRGFIQEFHAVLEALGSGAVAIDLQDGAVEGESDSALASVWRRREVNQTAFGRADERLRTNAGEAVGCVHFPSGQIEECLAQRHGGTVGALASSRAQIVCRIVT